MIPQSTPHRDRRARLHRCDRCSLCVLQRRRVRPTSCLGRELERHLVSAVRICGHQLYGKRHLRPFCRSGFVARRIRLGNLAEAR